MTNLAVIVEMTFKPQLEFRWLHCCSGLKRLGTTYTLVLSAVPENVGSFRGREMRGSEKPSFRYSIRVFLKRQQGFH